MPVGSAALPFCFSGHGCVRQSEYRTRALGAAKCPVLLGFRHFMNGSTYIVSIHGMFGVHCPQVHVQRRGAVARSTTRSAAQSDPPASGHRHEPTALAIEHHGLRDGGPTPPPPTLRRAMSAHGQAWTAHFRGGTQFVQVCGATVASLHLACACAWLAVDCECGRRRCRTATTSAWCTRPRCLRWDVCTHTLLCSLTCPAPAPALSTGVTIGRCCPAWCGAPSLSGCRWRCTTPSTLRKMCSSPLDWCGTAPTAVSSCRTAWRVCARNATPRLSSCCSSPCGWHTARGRCIRIAQLLSCSCGNWVLLL